MLRSTFACRFALIFAAASSPAFSQPVQEREVKQLIDVMAVGAHLDPPHYFVCDQAALQKRVNEMGRYFAQGNSSLASGYAHSIARDMAACYIENPTSDVPYIHAAHDTLPEIAEEVGSAMTMEAIVTEDPTTIAHAKTFLQFAKENGRNVDAMMRRLAGDGAEKLPAASAALSTTAVSITSSYKSNSFGFDQQFKDKILQVSGRVHAITGQSGKASVTLLGNLDKPPSSLNFPDYVECKIEQPDSLKKAAALAKGQETTVRGIYAENLMGEILLSRCEIVR